MSDDHDAELIEVASFASSYAAEAARVLLEEVDIEAMVVADDAGGAIPSLGVGTGGARLLVRKEDSARALDLLGAEGQG